MSAQTSRQDESVSPEEERYRILVEFAHKHLDFQMAELESVLNMHGIRLGDEATCRFERLPNETSVEKGKVTNRPFLILSFPLDSPLLPRAARSDQHADTETDIASIILSRCVLVRNVMELWAPGTSIAGCVEATQKWLSSSACGQRVFPRVSPQTWKLSIHTLGTKYTFQEQAGMREHFSFLDLAGKVRMEEPDNDFVLIREIELDASGSPLYPRFSPSDRKIIPENDSRPPLAWYFVRSLCGNRITKGRGQDKFSLRRRRYLGPTSMDSELSFVMTNLGQVTEKSIAFDPFVGTGSILLSCALRGAYCIGTDIDIRVLRGRSQHENVFSNFEQFGMRRPELIRSDNALYSRHFRTEHCLYDAIICDPPYGIRAGARKCGSKLDKPRPVSEEFRHDHIAQTKVYSVSDVMADLLDVAARTLVMGGRLVYVIPSFKDFNPEDDLPHHECLKIVHICFQPLGHELGRRLVAMEKVKDYDVSRRDIFMSMVWKNGAESAEKCANIRDKIMENAKKKPHYAEKLAHRKKKRKQNKEEKRKAKRSASEQISDVTKNQPERLE